MAVYKTKTFNRWATGIGLDDENLQEAATEVAEGTVEADLGGGVYKKRVALLGKGKSGGARTLIAFRKGEHTFYLYGFRKNERANIFKKKKFES